MKQSSCIRNVYQTCQKVQLGSYMYGSRSRACPQDLTDSLPEGCIAKIFSYLENLEDWQSCATVCWSWAYILVSEQPQFWGPLSALQAVNPCIHFSDVVDTKLVAAVVGIRTRDVVTGLDLQCAPGDVVASGVPQLTDKGIHFVTHACRKMKSVRLINCLSLTNKAARIIASNCPALENLEIIQSPISDDGLSQVAKQCKHLKSLHIEGSMSITEASLRALVQDAKRLVSLTLGSCPQIGEEAIMSFLKDKPYLDKLVLKGMMHGCSHLDGARESLVLHRTFSLFRQLRSLILVKCPGLQDMSLLKFSRIQCGGLQLQDLVIDDCQGVTQHGLMYLVLGVIPMKLKTIKLARFHFFTSRALIEVISLLSETIESVILDSCDFDIVMQYNLGGTVPRECQQLKVISVENCGSIMEPFLLWVSGVCCGIKELRLIGYAQPVRNYGILSTLCGILHHNGITKIELSSCDITDVHVFIIVQTCMETLQEINLDDSPIFLGYSALFFRNCPNLVKLGLSRLPIDDNYISTVMWPGFHHLEEVNLTGCPRITDMTLDILGSSTSLPRLRRVNVSGCPGITKDAIAYHENFWETERFWEIES